MIQACSANHPVETSGGILQCHYYTEWRLECFMLKLAVTKLSMRLENLVWFAVDITGAEKAWYSHICKFQTILNWFRKIERLNLKDVIHHPSIVRSLQTAHIVLMRGFHGFQLRWTFDQWTKAFLSLFRPSFPLLTEIF